MTFFLPLIFEYNNLWFVFTGQLSLIKLQESRNQSRNYSYNMRR